MPSAPGGRKRRATEALSIAMHEEKTEAAWAEFDDALYAPATRKAKKAMTSLWEIFATHAILLLGQ